MIGQTIEAQSRIPVGAMLFAAVGVTLVVLGRGLGNVNWSIGAVLPGMISLFLFRARDREMVARFKESGIEVEGEAEIIPYEKIIGVWAAHRPLDLSQEFTRPFAMQVMHESGSLYIPARLNVSSDDVFRFLCGLMSDGGTREVNSRLEPYLRQHEETFGADRVWSFAARKQLGTRPVRRVARAVCLAMLLGGLVWFVIGLATVKQNDGAWIAAGLSSTIFGGLFYLLFRFESRPNRITIKNWQQASLVITPVGLAMVQGDVQGEMRWDELRDVKLHAKLRSFQFHSGGAVGPGIELVVEGASIVIADIYDRPLPLIYDRLRQYWR